MTKNIENIETKTEGFSEKELDKLKFFPDSRVLADFMRSQLAMLHKSLVDQKIGPEGFENLCVVATDELNKKLQEVGFVANILEGDLEMSPKNWLVHRVNLVKLSDYWVVMDLTASQLLWFKNRTWLLETTSPDPESLKEFLKNNYRWWIKGK
mgnify:FL=1